MCCKKEKSVRFIMLMEIMKNENIEIVKFSLSLLNNEESIIEYVEDRLGHDRRYTIDNEKIVKEIEWTPLTNLEKGLKKTIE